MPSEAKQEVLKALEAACSSEGLSSKHASQWVERLRPVLPQDRVREGVRGLLAALGQCDRSDPLRALEAVESFLGALPQVRQQHRRMTPKQSRPASSQWTVASW